MGRWKINSIQTRILLWTGLSLLAIAASIIVLAATSLRTQAINDAEANAVAEANAEAAKIQAKIEVALDAGRTMAQSLEGVASAAETTLSRDQVNSMLRQVLARNPDFLGTYTLWEPNAFDGLDAQYANTPLHDETGRFIPYWYRADNGEIQVEALLDYETEGIGDWYLLPKRTKQEQVLDPFLYPIQGQDVLLTSLVAPVVVDNQFYGIAGVDLRIDFLQSLADQLDIFAGAGELVLISNNGTLAGVTGRPDLVGQAATVLSDDYATVLEQIQQGNSFNQQFGNRLSVFVPIVFGQTQTPWSVNILIPYSTITADANRVVTRMVVFGIILTAVALLIFWFISRQIAHPLVAMTETVLDISGGNLEARVNVQSSDETGVLARTFNNMATQLQTTLAGLEATVASRTKDLALAAEVGQRLSLVRDPDSMLIESVELINERFNLYYTQIYLVDPASRSLVLRAGTGEIGRTLRERGHRLPLDLSSLNGTAAVERRAVIVDNTETSTIHRLNPLLPDTRSEMVVPLIAQNRVLGVLDMQSAQIGALSAENLPAFEALAGQLAITIVNAQLFVEAERARQNVELQARRLTRTSWSDFLNAIDSADRIAFTYDRERVTQLAEPLPITPAENTLVSPIQVTNELVGTFQFIRETAWTEDDQQLVQTVTNQVAQQIENLRILGQAERYQAEAQEALRRLTREGWETYQSQKGIAAIGFEYRDNQVQPVTDTDRLPATGVTYDIKVHDEPIGYIDISGAEHVSPDDAELITAINGQLAAHLENLRLSQQTELALADTEAQAEKLAALNTFSTALSQAETLDAVFTVASMHLPAVISADRQSMTRLTPDKMLEVFGLQGAAGAIPTGAQLPITGSAVGAAFTSQQPIIIPDLTANSYLENARLMEQGLRSTLTVPLVVIGQSIGTLNFGSVQPFYYTNRERDLAVQAASLMASAIENRNLLEQTQEQAKRLAALNTLSAELGRAENLEGILKASSVQLSQIIPSERNSITWLSEDQQTLAVFALQGEAGAIPTGAQLPVEGSMVGAVAKTLQPIIVDDLSQAQYLESPQLVKQGLRSAMSVPLIASGRVLGTMNFGNSIPALYGNNERDLAVQAASLIAGSIENRNLFDQTQARAQREAVLRQITAAVRSSNDPATILRTAARELGNVMGRRTFIRMVTSDASQNKNESETTHQ